jgi:hypothetical protein
MINGYSLRCAALQAKVEVLEAEKATLLKGLEDKAERCLTMEKVMVRDAAPDPLAL